MSLTALLLAGALLGQTVDSLPGQPADSQMPLATPQFPDAGAAGGYGAPSASLPPPAFPERTNAPGWGAVKAPTGQPDGQATPPAETGAADPISDMPLPMQRLLDRYDASQREKAAAEAATNPSSVYGAGTQPGLPPADYGMSPAAPRDTPLARQPRLSLKELLDESMTLPPGAKIQGSPVSLLDMMGNVTDRSRRVEIAHAYWRLAQALGEYRSCWDQAMLLQSLRLGTIDALVLQSARQTAAQDIAAAELSLIEAQHFLAEAARLESTTRLPLPSSRPHLGTYNTYYAEIAATQTPPAGIGLIHRILPLQRQVIDVRLEALHAAQDASEAVAGSYQTNLANAADLLAALRRVTDQRRAWIAAVAQYNHLIADYALAIAGPETTGRDLISILIKLSRSDTPATGDRRAAAETGLAPLLAGQASDPPPQADAPAAKIPGRPTLAPPKEEMAKSTTEQGIPPVPTASVASDDLAVEPASAEEPIDSDAEARVDPAVAAAVRETPAEQPAPEVETDEPAEEKVADAEPTPEIAPTEADTDLEPRKLVVQSRPLVAVQITETPPRRRVALKPQIGTQLGPRARKYESLEGLLPAIQAKKLTGEVLRSADSARLEGELIELDVCLKETPASHRRGVIEAYWRASLRVAQYQTYRKHVDLLDDLLESTTLGAGATPQTRSQLKAARLDAEADMLEAESRLLTAQHELTRQCDRSLAGRWFLPQTLPHAGTYQMRADSQPRHLTDSWPFRRLAVTIPALQASLQNQARAVIEADRQRVQAATDFYSRPVAFDRVLTAAEEQTDQTLAFFDVLSAYNQSIADYAITVAPSAISGEQFVAALIVR